MGVADGGDDVLDFFADVGLALAEPGGGIFVVEGAAAVTLAVAGGQIVGERTASHAAEGKGPGAGHDADVVPAAAEGEPGQGRMGGEIGEGAEEGLMAGCGEGEAGEGIFEMGVDAELGDKEVGAEAGDQGRHDLAEGPEVRIVGGVGREGDVDAVAGAVTAAALADEAGTGKEGAAVLVEGDGEHAAVVVEGVLDAVAVVNVDVDVGDAQPLAEQPLYGDGGVVEDAEAGGEVRAAVVEAAAVAEGDVAVAAGKEVGGL